MPTKAQMYAQMAEEAARQVTGSRESWTSFLTTAARLYKYPYHEQLMIHKQRPEATACAEYDFWNERMGRYVKRGSKGIALVVYDGNQPRLRYVFDVADTGGRRNSRPVKLWTMEDEYRKPVMEALEKSYGVSAADNSLETQLEEIARQLAAEYWNDFGKNIIDIVEDSFLMEYDEYNIGASFRNAATISITYALYSRCCGNPDDYFEHEDFLDIFDFNTRQTANYLGTAVSELSSQVFREIEVTIRNYERMKQAERSQDDERDHLQTGRGLPDSQHRADSHGEQASGQVRADAPGVPEGAQSYAPERPDSQRAAVPASLGDRRDSASESGAADGRAAGAESRTGQGDPADGVGTAHEQPESTGGGDRSVGTGEQLTLNLFLSEAEQISLIDEAESKKPSAFSFSGEQIDQMLIAGGNEPDLRMMVVLEYMKGKSTEEIAKRLPELYRGSNGFKLDGAEVSVWFDEQCVHIARGKTARFAPSRQVVSWQEAAERIGKLLDSGEYATNVELVEALGYERTKVAESLWYLVHDLSENGRELGCLASLQELGGGGFPDETKTLADKLEDSEFRSVLMAEYQRFLETYRDDRSILRFHYHKLERLEQRLEELSLPLREYHTDMAMAPVVRQFITDDEINESLSGGSGFSGGKARIYAYWQSGHSAQDKANFLKNEYGTGGHSHALSGAPSSGEDHDAKGIRYTKAGCDKVQLSWAQVASRIDVLMKQERYFDKDALEQYQLETAAAAKALEELQRDTVRDAENEQMPVGCIEYLGTNGTPGEVVEYTDEEQFLKTIKEDTFYGVPLTVVLYRNEQGNTISQDFLNELDPPPKGFRVEDAPTLAEKQEQHSMEDSPFVQQVMKDVQAIASEEETYERFSVIETEGGYAVWDDIRDEIYVDEQGVSEEFTSEWQANDYLQEVKKTVSEKEAAEWLYVEQSKLEAEVEAWETQQSIEKKSVVDTLSEQEQTIVHAMETAGFMFTPQAANPGLHENLVFAAGENGYPLTFENWTQAYEWIDRAELRDTPGLREQVQQILHPDAQHDVLTNEEFAAKHLIPGQTVVEIDDRTFRVESVDLSIDKVELRDVTFANAVGFPIFRAENIGMVRHLLEQQMENQVQQPDHFIHHYYVVEDLQVRGALQLKEYGTFEEAMAAYQSLPTDKIKALGVQNTRTPLPGSLDLIQCKDGQDTLIKDYERVDGWQNPEILELVGKIDALLQENSVLRVPAENYVITDDSLGEGGAKLKYVRNVAAIRTLFALEEENRTPTPEEQEILANYVGWGGLADAFDPNKPAWAQEYTNLKNLLPEREYEAARASTLNAHFTSPTVIRAIYDAVGRMGFETGNILEPSMGVGNFFGMLPPEMRNSQLYGVELDSITGRIAQKLYPKADITVAGFETTNRRDFFDLAVGNVPFGNYKVADKPYDKLGFSIHNYFFAKALDQVRPGGVIAFVTSRYTMDSKNMDARKYIAQRAELLGAIRLPNNAFKANAGTEVVSDIIFLQKRDHPIDIVPDWVHLNTTPDGFTMNSYFVEHPEMVLGELTTESTQYGKEDLTVRPHDGVELSELLREAVTHIEGTYTPVELTEDVESQEKEQVTIPARPDVKNFSYTVVDGEVYFRENSVMRLVELNDKAKERVCGMVELRRIVNELMEYQLEDYPDEAIAQKQQELNDAYDAFTAKNGLINNKANEKAFSDDSAYYLLCSLENVDEDGNLKSKADMFTKRTIRPERKVTSVDTPAEALAVCIGERGKVDLPFMAQLMGTEDTAKIAADLRGVIFRIPELLSEGSTPHYVTADEYLSGNVREKLRQAQMAVQVSEEYRPNLEALEKAQPKDLDASEIDVRLGATWIDADYIQQFMQETFETPYYLRRNIEVKFSDITAEWRISGKSSPSHNDVAAYMTYGTDRANAYRILEETLNLKDIRIYDTIEDADGKQRRVLNKKQTTLAQQKQQAIKDAFRDWIWKDPRRREALVTKYNEMFNSTRPREYNGDHIVFGGMNPDITLREHQKNAIAHVLYGGNTLLAHEVGAGKTFEMVASAMESKRLGLCQKSLFVVPNHLTTQWASEFLRLYPSANILVTTKKDFEPQNRKKFCARIATGDYDAVIIGHSQFEKIPLSAERQERQLREQIDEIEGAIAELKWQRGENFSIKQMEKTRKSLQTRLDKLLANDRKDDVVTFEQLGVDRLFVDESHAFKNLFLYTKMRNVAGLSTSEAQKSSDMFMKCRYLDEITGGRGVIFATGTPVSNSMTELYTVMRYLQYATLQKKNLTHFVCWASTFGETTTAIELAPEGTGYRARTRFAKFFNLPELMNMFKEVADIKTSDQLHLPVPDAKFETVVVEPSEHQQDMVAELSERAAAVHSGVVDPSVDNMLKITSDGRKLGLDQRLMNPLLPDDPDSKLNACVRNVLRIWEEGKADKLTQLLFCDLSTPKNDGTFNVYDDIKAKLMAAGVPEKEIAFIHTADTEVKKKELFAKVRTGQVRVLLGSTQKMGAGTNCQDRLVALHHLDVGWRPSDMTQRNGRIIRQGNMNKEVQVYQYVTEGTFDAYLYQTLENKQKFISQIMTSKSPVRSCDDVDEQALSYAEIKVLCAGNPLIKEKMDLDIEVARLKVLKADHQSQQYRMEDKLLKYFPAEIERQQGYIQGFEADVQTVAAHPQITDGFCGMELLGKHYTEKADAGERILAACKEVKSTEPVSLGTYRGFNMELSFDSFRHEFDVVLKGAMSHRVSLGIDARGNITRLDNALAAVSDRLKTAREQLTNLQNQQEATRAELGKPFPQEAELAQKSARLAELDAELNMDDKSASEHAEERPSVLADLKSKSERIPPARRSEEKEEVL